MKTIDILNKQFRNKISGKKGIIFLDMDGVLCTFPIIGASNSDFDIKTQWIHNNNEYDADFLTEYGFPRQGINEDVIKYLIGLKDDYLFISNTSWSYKQMKEFPQLTELFDFYGSDLGSRIEFFDDNGKYHQYLLDNVFVNRTTPKEECYEKGDLDGQINLDSVIPESHRNSFRKFTVNKLFRQLAEINELNNLRTIQFEDDLTKTIDITDFVFLAREPGKTGNQVSLDDIVAFYQEVGIDTVNVSSIQLGSNADGVMKWCQENL